MFSYGKKPYFLVTKSHDLFKIYNLKLFLGKRMKRRIIRGFQFLAIDIKTLKLYYDFYKIQLKSNYAVA